MVPSEITKWLTAARSITFFVLLSLSAWTLTFELNYAVFLPILTIIQLGLENLLGMVQPATLSTLNHHRGMLILNIPLNWAWIICNSLYSYQIRQQRTPADTPPPKAELVYRWMVVAAFIIHILIGALQVEEIKKRQRVPTMPTEVKVDVEVSEKSLLFSVS
jgi:hypothetical protein